MRRSTTLALVAGGATAAVAGAALARGRLAGSGAEAMPPDEDSQYTLFAPGGPRGLWFNGPVGWAFAKIQPILHAGVYGAVADVLDLQPEDELLDIGCGPGAFLASKGQHVRRVAGLDASPSCCARPKGGSRTGLPQGRRSWCSAAPPRFPSLTASSRRSPSSRRQ